MLSKYSKQYYTKDQPKTSWKLARGLNNKYSDTLVTHEAFTHNRILGDKAHAKWLNKHFASVGWLQHRRQNRHIFKRQHAIPQNTDMTPPFTTQMVSEDKNTASMGSDDKSNLHLKHLGTQTIRALTAIFNVSITQNKIPTSWKLAKVVFHSEAQKVIHGTNLLQTNITSIHPLQNTREGCSIEHNTTHLTRPRATQHQT